MDQLRAQRHVPGSLAEPEPSQGTSLATPHLGSRRAHSAFLFPARHPARPTPPLSASAQDPPPQYPLYPPSPAFAALPTQGHAVLRNHYSNPASPALRPSTLAHFRTHCPHHDTSSDYLRLSPTLPSYIDSPPDYHSINFDHSDSSSRVYGDSHTSPIMDLYDTRRTSLLLGGHHIDWDDITSSPARPHAKRPRSLSPNFSGYFANGSSSHPSDLPRSRRSGDMSDRPLDKIRAEARAADRRLKQRKRATYTDCIDRLDTIAGSPYHHAGPYDAALPCRNRILEYSPLAAVQESKMEAIRATPRENLVDALSRHVPLHGTASVAPGAADLSGNVMDYSEGADLMREEDAPGGAYRRWTGFSYHADDLKGKGEPSFTLERELKAKKHQKHTSACPSAPLRCHPVTPSANAPPAPCPAPFPPKIFCPPAICGAATLLAGSWVTTSSAVSSASAAGRTQPLVIPASCVSHASRYVRLSTSRRLLSGTVICMVAIGARGVSHAILDDSLLFFFTWMGFHGVASICRACSQAALSFAAVEVDPGAAP